MNHRDTGMRQSKTSEKKRSERDGIRVLGKFHRTFIVPACWGLSSHKKTRW